jgi:hypothetical protein
MMNDKNKSPGEDDLTDKMTVDELKQAIKAMINEDIERYVGREKTITEDK